MTTPRAAFRDFLLRSIDGQPLPMARFDGQVVLLVNVASQCGFTPQYEGLERLWQRFGDQGLVVLGCPCDQFGAQEPGDDAEIARFCSLTYNVTFPLSSKLDVNGAAAAPLWQWVKAEEPGVLGTTSVKWNFTKFLIGRDGMVLERFAPTVTPDELVEPVERALSAPPVVR